MDPIETPRLILRPLTAADAEPLARLWTDPQVTAFMGGPRDYAQMLVNVAEDAAVNPAPQFDLWPVVEKASGQVIGHCGLLDKEVDGRDEVELVYVFAVSAWGKGYATEAALALRGYAFGALGLTRLISLIEPENAASAHVAEKAGLRLEKEVLRPSGRMMQVYAIDQAKDLTTDKHR
jgi:[ribosomal protein S5]-alanine N-acetyltransferase